MTLTKLVKLDEISIFIFLSFDLSEVKKRDRVQIIYISEMGIMLFAKGSLAENMYADL